MTEKTITLPVTGMTCANCAANIERGLKKLEGVQNSNVNFAAEQAIPVSGGPTAILLIDANGDAALDIVTANGTVGDNGTQSSATRGGNFYGLVVMPSYEIIEDRLEGVVRYAYQSAEEDEGIRTNSRFWSATRRRFRHCRRGPCNWSVVTWHPTR